jgi:hypothetical protein
LIGPNGRLPINPKGAAADLIAKTEIVHAARAEITQDAEPVGDRDDNDTAPACELVGVVLGRFTTARHVRAAM